MNKILLKYLNSNLCVTLPNRNNSSSSDYLKSSNFLSEYLTDYEKLEVLRNLGVLNLIEEINKSVDNKLNSFVTLEFLADNFVKKGDVYNNDEDDDYYFEDWSESDDESSSYGGRIVDDELSLVSTNPVLNKVITQILSEIPNLEDIIQILRDYTGQTKLVAGYGITIKGNVISSTLDMNPFVVVNSLPTTNINPTKIYLVHSDGNNYILYKYILDESFISECPLDGPGEWVRIGETNIGIDLSSLIPDGRYQPVGDYVTTYQLNQLLKRYVKKSEVYTPKLWGSGDDDDDPSGEDPNYDPSSPVIPGTVNFIIDSFLSTTSTNAVLNCIITRELEKKQNTLIPGEGITIENGVISSTFDTSLYEIVTSLPLSGNPNKIYLLETTDGRYKEYIYLNNRWVFKGYRDFGVDLTKYVNKQELEAYAKISYVERYYATKEDIAGLSTGTGGLSRTEVELLINDALEGIPDALESLQEIRLLLEEGGTSLDSLQLALSSKANTADVYTKIECDDKFQPKGNYLTQLAFNTYKTQITDTLNEFTVDESLSLTSTKPVLNKIITAALAGKANTSDFSNYLTTERFNEKIALYNLTRNFKTINNNSIIGTGNIEIKFSVDTELSSSSINPVLNKVINAALNDKVDTSYLVNLLNKLIPGTGISIDENNIISVLIDTNPFIIIDELPLIGQENKLYLVKNGNQYTQYIYENGEWIDKGSISFDVDLRGYLKSSDADTTYFKISDYQNSLNTLSNWILNTFVKKDDIYTPSQVDKASESIEDPYEPNVNPVVNPTIRNTFYESNIPNGIKTNLDVGNINSGTDISLLKGKTFSELFDMLLFKEIWPNADARHTVSLTVPSNIVKIGTPIVLPTVVAQWNLNILPISTILNNLSNVFIDYTGETVNLNNSSYYTTAGNHTFTLNYSYPSGKLTIISNYNNMKDVTISADSGTITKVVKVTYPWYINGVEQSTLVPIRTLHVATVTLTGTPVIEIPGDLSECSIQANLGLGYMDVNWNKTMTLKNGITYSVWTKPDLYSLNVEHLILFTMMFSNGA